MQMKWHNIVGLDCTASLGAISARLFKTNDSLVNVLLKFQMLKSEIRHYFLSKKCKKLLQCKSYSHFFNKKFQCIW